MALRFLDSWDHYTTLTQKWTTRNGGNSSIAAGALRTGIAGLRFTSTRFNDLQLTIDAQGTWIIGVAFRAANFGGAAVTIQIGDGAGIAFVQRIPGIFAVNGLPTIIEEPDIQDWEFADANDIYAQSTAGAAAPADVQIQVTVEEYQGPTG